MAARSAKQCQRLSLFALMCQCPHQENDKTKQHCLPQNSSSQVFSSVSLHLSEQCLVWVSLKISQAEVDCFRSRTELHRVNKQNNGMLFYWICQRQGEKKEAILSIFTWTAASLSLLIVTTPVHWACLRSLKSIIFGLFDGESQHKPATAQTVWSMLVLYFSLCLYIFCPGSINNLYCQEVNFLCVWCLVWEKVHPLFKLGRHKGFMSIREWVEDKMCKNLWCCIFLEWNIKTGLIVRFWIMHFFGPLPSLSMSLKLVARWPLTFKM